MARRRNLLALGASVLAIQLAGCSQPTDAPYFDPRLLQRSERTLAPLDRSETLPKLSTEQEDPLGGLGNALAGTTRPADITAGPSTGPALGSDGEPILRLTLQQAIQRAVLYNHDVKVAGYQPAIDASRVTEAEGLFDPVLFSNLQLQKKEDQTAGSETTIPSLGITNAEVVETDFTKEDIYTAQAGVKQNLASGGQVQVDFDTSYTLTNPQQFVDNPFWTNKVNLQLTQPLLRAFGAKVNQAKIFISRNDARVSVMEFRKAVEDNISKVEEAYWQLVQDQQDVEVEEGLLKEDESSYRLQFNRLQKGLISSLEVSQVQTSLESRRGNLIVAKNKARSDSDQLKQLMSDPNLPVASPVLIVPSDEPVAEPMQFDVNDQISSAMENRFELGEQLLKIDTASVTYDLAQNNTLPKLDLVASVAPNAVDTDFPRTVSRQVGFQRFAAEYAVGLNLEIPIGNREALAILRRTALQRQQAIEQYAALVSQVALDVRQRARDVETAYKVILTSRQSRLAAKRALDDVIERQEKQTEALTPEFVQLRLDLADRFGQAEESEAQALAEYNVTLERLERAKGTLLKYNNVILQEEPYQDQGLLK